MELRIHFYILLPTTGLVSADCVFADVPVRLGTTYHSLLRLRNDLLWVLEYLPEAFHTKIRVL
jgi:hypothetical protein